jgi:DNA-binding GntR family transcriptional regulator
MAGSAVPEDHSDPNDRLVFRRGKLRPRENDEVRMMRDALADLGDLRRVKGILLELGRFYNPVTNASVVAPDLRRRVVSLLEAGDAEGARALLEAHLAEYQKMDDRPTPRPE